MRAVLPRAAAPEKIRLADARLVLAREYGFPSWTKLKYRVEAIDLSDPHTAEWTFGRSAETIAALLEAGAMVEPVSRFPSGNEEIDDLLRRYGKV